MPDHAARVRAIRDSLPAHLQWDERELALLDLAEAQARDLETLEGQTDVRALAEARQARLALGRLLGLIDIPGGSDRPAQVHARKAANSRWGNVA